MFDDTGTLELISTITEFNDIHEFMQDKELDGVLALLVKAMVKDEVPTAHKLLPIIVKLQAYSAKMAILATYYATIGKGPSGSKEAIKKNIYYTTRDALDKLVDALKIVVRYG